MLDFEYALFTKEDPIKLLKDVASKLPFHKKIKIAPHIRRASAAVGKCKKFRDIVTNNDNVIYNDIGSTFARYFGKKIDRGQFMSLPKYTTKEYVEYMASSCGDIITPDKIRDDKYMESITKIILSHSDYIDAFVKAFLSIRLAQGELDKLKSNWDEIIPKFSIWSQAI